MNHKQPADEKIVYCIRGWQDDYDNDQGFLQPIFEETVDGLIPVNSEDYKDKGFIRVNCGYNTISNNKKSQFFRIGITASIKWLEKNENGINENPSKSLSRYIVRHNNTIELAKYLDVCLLIEGYYPEPEHSGGMKCLSDSIPADGFFISCINPEGKKVIIGPLDVKAETVNENGIFHYKASDRPFKATWSHRIRDIPHSSLIFDRDLIPDGLIFTINGNEYLVNCDNLPHTSAQLIDLSTDDNIVKWASKLFKNSDLSNQLSKLKGLFDKIPTDLNLPNDIFESRKKRLQDLSGKLSQIEGFNQILADYLRLEEGQEAIKRYVEANSNRLLEKFFEKEVKLKSHEAEKQIAENEKKFQSLSLEIEKLEKTKENWKNSKEGIELEEIRQEIKLLRKEKDIIYDVDKLKTHKEFLSDEIEQLKTKKREADSFLSMVQNKIGASQEEQKLKLSELKIGLDAISGNVNHNLDLKTIISNKLNLKHIGEKNDEVRLNVIKTLTNHLKNRGRIVKQDDIAILLTCIMQSLIVTLAGKPGSGKSSTVNELAHVLGLKEENKYVHIQVQRGWSSDRDLLGFYNKLSNYYDPDNFGLYKLLNGLQEIPAKYQFSIVLLDEANLSPIEHYWSGFMGSCDNSENFSLAGTKPGEYLILPTGLRFIATVNYDRTTEPLSSRFLDRSPVIYLEENSISGLLNQKEVTDNDGMTYYSFDDLESIFGKDSSAVFTSDEEIIMEEIWEKYRFLNINHRKIEAIRNFTATLRNVLDENESDMLKAFDYALLIYVIPLINGQGIEYSNAIKQFDEYLSFKGMIRAQNRLTTIIANGKQFDAYSYFS